MDDLIEQLSRELIENQKLRDRLRAAECSKRSQARIPVVEAGETKEDWYATNDSYSQLRDFK